MLELAYSLHLGSDKNRKNVSRVRAKSNASGTTSLSNNAIQNARQLSRVDKHNYRKYDDKQHLIEIVRGTTSLYNDVQKLYKDEFEEAIYYVQDKVFYFDYVRDNRAIIRIFPMEDYCKIDPDIKMKEYRYGIIYIRENDEFQMQDIDSAFDYIPDETNDSVIYMREQIPIEIGVKPVKKELLSIEE